MTCGHLPDVQFIGRGSTRAPSRSFILRSPAPPVLGVPDPDLPPRITDERFETLGVGSALASGPYGGRLMKSRSIFVVLVSASLFAGGCVSKGTYDQAVSSADATRAELLQTKRGMQQRIESCENDRAALQTQLDDATAVDDQLSKQLAKLGGDSQALLAANGTLKDTVESSRRRLEELRRAQAAAESRAALYRELLLKFKTMVDAGDLAITLRQGRMVLRLPNDVLFDSGRSELKPEGKRALSLVADVLVTIPERRFQVAGHTDSDPIRLSPYKSNWDLSAARALQVTSFLISKGMDPHALSEAGYGEFDPIDTNETGAGKAHNRRTEISLQPNIDELVAVPDAP
jgi:chemotaxis protein MotB